MPTPSIVSAIVGGIIGAIADSATEQPQQTPIYTQMARAFPADSKKGELSPPVQQEITISGNKMNVSPGLQIRNQQNLIVMASTLREAVPVRYQLDQAGNVWRIWLLSATEASAPDLKQ